MMAQARAQDNYESALAAGASGETLLALQKELEARNRILNQTKANDIRDTAEENTESWLGGKLISGLTPSKMQIAQAGPFFKALLKAVMMHSSK